MSEDRGRVVRNELSRGRVVRKPLALHVRLTRHTHTPSQNHFMSTTCSLQVNISDNYLKVHLILKLVHLNVIFFQDLKNIQMNNINLEEDILFSYTATL